MFIITAGEKPFQCCYCGKYFTSVYYPRTPQMEFFRLTQCYHCLAYDHIKTYCPHKNQNRICPRCGGNDHLGGSCKNPLSCIHCQGSHYATARCCPTYKRIFHDKLQDLVNQFNSQRTSPGQDQQCQPITTSVPVSSRVERDESWTRIQR